MILLDAYAVIAYLKGEPLVAPRLHRLLARKPDAVRPAAITAVNAAEVIDHLVRVCDVDSDEAALDLAQLDLVTIAVDERMGRLAGLLRARHYHPKQRQVSLADCIGVSGHERWRTQTRPSAS